MNQHSPQIDPIFKTGTLDAAILVIHGFTASPDSMRPLINHLNELGFHVEAPLLAGHGRTLEQLSQSRWTDWYDTVQVALKKLKEKHRQVFVTGLSLGGVLTLKLAEEFDYEIDGIACLATPVFLEPWVHVTLSLLAHTPLRLIYKYHNKGETSVKDPEALKNYWHIKKMPVNCLISLVNLQKKVRMGLQNITADTLLIHSLHDTSAPYENMEYIERNLKSPFIETVTLENSFHLITLDYDKDIVNQSVGDFFMHRTRKP